MENPNADVTAIAKAINESPMAGAIDLEETETGQILILYYCTDSGQRWELRAEIPGGLDEHNVHQHLLEFERQAQAINTLRADATAH